MIGTDSDYYNILKDALSGKKAADGHVFESVEVLKERLARIKKLSDCFAEVDFSDAVKKLASQKKNIAVC